MQYLATTELDFRLHLATWPVLLCHQPSAMPYVTTAVFLWFGRNWSQMSDEGTVLCGPLILHWRLTVSLSIASSWHNWNRLAISSWGFGTSWQLPSWSEVPLICSHNWTVEYTVIFVLVCSCVSGIIVILLKVIKVSFFVVFCSQFSCNGIIRVCYITAILLWLVGIVAKPS